MEIKGRTRFKAPIDEETFLDISSTCFDQESRSNDYMSVSSGQNSGCNINELTTLTGRP